VELEKKKVVVNKNLDVRNIFAKGYLLDTEHWWRCSNQVPYQTGTYYY
jgi:hypothetical protein